MSDPLKFIPPRVPLLDPRTGLITREWYMFFQGVFNRIGGSNGQSIPDLVQDLPDDAGLEELKLLLYTQVDALGQDSPRPTQQAFDDVLAEVNALREQVAELLKVVQDMQQGSTL